MKSKPNPFLPYNKKELVDRIDLLKIYQEGKSIITKYGNRTISVSDVSEKYEIFDIKNFIISKLDQIEENFPIKFYRLSIKGGVQFLTLLSDTVDFNGNSYHKSFFILNSTNRSYKLSFDMGLYCTNDGSSIITSANNISLNKKHLKGITELAYDTASHISDENFTEQIQSLSTLMGHSVPLSKLKELIVHEDNPTNHRKFDSFKNMILSNLNSKLSNSEILFLRTPSESIVLNTSSDILLDAIDVFNCYIRVFSNKNSCSIKKEADRIMKMTQFMIRKEKLSTVLSFQF